MWPSSCGGKSFSSGSVRYRRCTGEGVRDSAKGVLVGGDGTGVAAHPSPSGGSHALGETALLSCCVTKIEPLRFTRTSCCGETTLPRTPLARGRCSGGLCDGDDAKGSRSSQKVRHFDSICAVYVSFVAERGCAGGNEGEGVSVLLAPGARQ